MEKWTRIAHQPCLPMGKDGRLVTACEEAYPAVKNSSDRRDGSSEK